MNVNKIGGIVLLIGVLLLILSIALIIAARSGFGYILIFASIITNVVGIYMLSYRPDED